MFVRCSPFVRNVPAFLCVCLSSWLWAGSFTAVNIGTHGSPRGYWEFLPDAYATESSRSFPVVIFFHGLGEGGNGNTQLSRVLKNGPPKILNSSSHPLHDLFENEEVIVLSPQVTENTWWNENHIRPYLDFVISHYRIDPRRIYFTGLSAGSSGIHQFLNDDPQADQITAAMTVAVRGSVNNSTGASSSSGVPYWALTAIGDVSSTAVNSVNHIAAEISGHSSNVMATYPSGTTQTHTASFDVSTGSWNWQQGVIPFVAGKPQPKLTLYPGSSHNSWTRTYDNADCWDWLFSQVKPEIRLSELSVDRMLQQGESLSLEAELFDDQGQSLSAADLSWESSLAGSLGQGSPLTLNNLGIGVHEITASYRDAQYRQRRVTTTATVLRSNACRLLIDVGDAGYETAGNWNQLTDRIDGELANAVADDGSVTGVSASITGRFDGIQTGGVLASDLYPETAQRDTHFVSATYPRGEILLKGLNPMLYYSMTLFASRTASNDRTGIYTVQGSSQQLNAQNNSSQSISFSQLIPTQNGEIRIVVERAPGASWAYLGVIELSTDGQAADNDSMSNSWEMAQFGNLLQEPDGDFDLDGISNLHEYAQGFAANDPTQKGKPEMVKQPQGAAFRYRRLRRDPLLRYQVYRSTNLLSGWQPMSLAADEVSVVVNNDSGVDVDEVTVLPEDPAPKQVFYRVEVILPPAP